MSLMGHDDLTLSEYLIYVSDFGVRVVRVFTLFLSVVTYFFVLFFIFFNSGSSLYSNITRNLVLLRLSYYLVNNTNYLNH